MAKPPAWALGPHSDIADWIEVRTNDDGSIDEIVTSKPVSFHLEQMDNDRYWIGLDTQDDDHQSIMITRKGKRLYPTAYR